MSDNPRLRTSFLVFLLVVCCPLLSHAEVGFQRSLIDKSSSYLSQRRPVLGLSKFQPRAILTSSTPHQTYAVEFDSVYTRATFTYRVGNTDILPPTILTYDEYRELRYDYDFAKQRREQTLKVYKRTGAQAGGEGIAIDVPFRIKSKTFRRLFGGDNVGVRVQGNITINGSLRNQKFSENQIATQRNTNTSFNIDMVQQFSITGKVGQKVEVKVDQDSERLFDFENSIRLTYTGDEDEIVQKIEAGNVNLNLGTNLATFSGKNTGLFGLKSQLKFGPLSVTGIASLERGQKNRQSPNQQGDRTAQFDERDFIKGVYFWLTDQDSALTDTGWIAIPNYRENYRHYFNRDHVAMDLNLQVVQVDVYVVAMDGVPSGETEYAGGRAVAMQFYNHLSLPEDAFGDSVETNGRNYLRKSWRRLDEDRGDYTVNVQMGVIRLRTPLESQQALAVAFSTVGGLTFGVLNAPDDGMRAVLLQSDDPSPTDSTWNLMFRHVYSLEATNLDPSSFKLEILREAPSSTQDESGPQINGYCPDVSQSCTYLSFFNFDLEGQGATPGADGFIDDHAGMRNYALGEIEFLDLTPFDPSGYIDAPNLNDIENPLYFRQWPLRQLEAQWDSGGFVADYLYNTRVSTHSQNSRRWIFNTQYRGSSSVFSLGPLVLEGSEEVTLNGAPLQRGIDYTIDYSSGELRILNEAAKAQGANLEITYESGQVFQLDKKTLLGARAEYELWDQSHIGGMVLHLSEKTLDKRVRIGNEPIKNTLYDMDASLRFQPNFLSRAVNALPLIRTDQGSELILDGEVARVFPNPNSLENPRTGDYNGLAYIDDFEGARRSTPLGLMRRMWSLSSIPSSSDIDPRRGRLRWWNPNTRDQVPVREVFPDREVNSQVANTLQSLVLEYTPDSTDGLPERSWGGVMRYLGEGYADQSTSEYLELWIKVPLNNRQGKLIIDLGEVSEDALPNGEMDSEDLPLEGQNASIPQSEYGNGLLDTSPNEDSGMDGIFGTDPTDSAHWNGLDRPMVPSWDDWSHASNSSDFTQINGTEGSRNDESGTYPDTEDLNDDDNLNTANNYYSYTIDLSSDQYIVGGQDNQYGWRLFRVPIQNADSSTRRRVGAPDLSSVRWARFYLTGMSRATTLELVQMDIVSSEWLRPQSASLDTVKYVSATVINTHENPGYVSPPGVEGEIDPITNLRQREQSLVLKINALDNADSSGNDDINIPNEYFLVKNLYQDYNLLEYKRLKMFVHGGGEDEAFFQDGKYQLILRFGQNPNDINNNYYDVVTTVKPGWNPQNHIDVTLNDISYMHARRDSVAADTNNPGGVTTTGRYAIAREDTPWPEDSLVIKGVPSFSRVRYVALGVRLNLRWDSAQNDEIWVDELRVVDIYKDPGTAGELSASLRIADFITLQGGYLQQDADFHNVNVRTSASGGGQASRKALRGNATIALHKLGVDRYGFQLPLSLAYTDNLSIPKYIPNTDTRVDPGNAPDEIKSEQKSFSYTVRYSKSGNSRNPFVRWSLEKLTLGWDYSYDKSRDFNTRRSTGETSSGSAGYSFPTAKGRGLAPLFFLKSVPVLNLLGSPRIYYKPTKLQFTANANKRTEQRETRQGQVTNTRLFNTLRSFNTGFNLIDPLTTDLTRSHRGKLNSGEWADVLQYDFGRTDEVQQTFNNNYSPEIASWLRPTFSYNTTYGWRWTNFAQDHTQSVSNSRNIGVDLQLDFRAILGGSGGGSGGRGRSGGRSDRGNGGGAPELPKRPGEEFPPGMDDPRMPMDPHGGMMEPRGAGPDSLQRGMPHMAGGVATGDPEKPSFSDSLGAMADTTGSRGDTTQRARRASMPIGQRLASVLSPIRKALMVLDPVSLSFDNTAQHSQGGLVGQAGLAYQFGFSQDPGLNFSSNAAQTQATTTKNRNFTGRSGIRFTSDIRSTFNYGYRTSESHTGNQPTGSVEQTEFWIGNKGKPARYPFVDVSMDWSGLEKFPFLSRVAQSVALSSAVANKVTEQWTSHRDSVRSREYTRQWNPFLGVNFTWKGNIDSQIRYGRTSRFSEQQGGSRSRSSEQSMTATVSYTIRTGFRIPVLFLRSLKLENQTTFSLNGDYRATKQETSTSAAPDQFAPGQGSQTAWSLQPRMTYSFSNTVQGQGYVQLQQTKQTVTGSTTRTFEFGIQVNIAIRG